MGDGRLHAASEARRARRRLAEEVARVEAELERARQLHSLAARRAGEAAERLSSGGGVLGALRRLFGRGGPDRVVLEREIAEARREHDELEGRIEAASEELRDLAARRDALGDAEGAYAELIEAAAARLRKSDDDQVTAELARHDALVREFDDDLGLVEGLLEAARGAEHELRLAVDSLGGVRRATGVDVAGGGVFVTGTRNRALDDARTHLDRAARHLQALGERFDRDAAVLERLDPGERYGLPRLLFGPDFAALGLASRLPDAARECGELLDRVRQARWAADRERGALREAAEAARERRAAWIEAADE